jgi:hypothetical protein
MGGQLTIAGDALGEFWVGLPQYGYRRNLTGTVNVLGDLRTCLWLITNDLGDPSDPNNPTKGRIRVHGSFDPVYGFGSIEIDGQRVGVGSYICFDYDGYDASDFWASGAVVIIGDPNDPNDVYTQNTPSARVWKITECRADMNNDGNVNLGDINPFVMALSDPNDYALAWPGLDASMSWKGDADCSGQFNLADVNAFTDRVTRGCCDPDCPGCEGDDGGGGELDPTELAGELAANVWPELYDDLVAIVAENVNLQPDDESRAYWQAVYDALTE